MKKKIPRKISLSVVGMQYRVMPTTRDMLRDRAADVPIKCKIEREPRNKADANAIRIVISSGPFRNLHIGYLRRQAAEILAPEIDAGKLDIIACVLTEVEPREGEGEILLTVKHGVKFPVNKLKTVG